MNLIWGLHWHWCSLLPASARSVYPGFALFTFLLEACFLGLQCLHLFHLTIFTAVHWWRHICQRHIDPVITLDTISTVIWYNSYTLKVCDAFLFCINQAWRHGHTTHIYTLWLLCVHTARMLQILSTLNTSDVTTGFVVMPVDLIHHGNMYIVNVLTKNVCTLV